MANNAVVGVLRALLTADTAEFDAAMKRAGGSVKAWQKDLKQVGKVTTEIGTLMTAGITVPLAAIGTAAIAASHALDDPLDQIRTQTGATGDLLKGLEGSFRTVFKGVPNDAEAVSTAIATLHQRLGLTGPALEQMATQLLTVARITKTDINDLIPQTAKLFTEWQVATEKQSGTLDFLFKTSQATGVGLDTLTSSLTTNGVALRALGFDLSQSAALLGQWERDGLNSQAMVKGLATAARDFTKENIPLADGLRQTVARIQELGPGTESAKLALDVFGKSGLTMRDAILAGKLSIDDLVATIDQSPETIMKAAEATDGFAEKWAQVKNNLLVALEPLGTKLLDILTTLQPALLALIGVLQSVADWFSELSPRTQTVVVGLGAVLAAVGPVLAAIGGIVSGIASLLPTLVTLGEAFGITGATLATLGEAFIAFISGPIGWLTAAVVGLGVVWVTWGDDITAVVKDTYAAVKEWLWDKLHPVLEPLIELLKSIGSAFTAFGDLVGAVVKKVIDLHIELVTTVTLWLVQKLQPIFKPLGVAISSIAGFFKDTYAIVSTVVQSLYTAVKTWLVDKFVAIVAAIKEKIDAVAGFFRDLKDKVVGHSFVPEMIDGIKEEFGRLPDVMVRPAKDATDNVTGHFRDMFSGLTSQFQEWGRGLTDLIGKHIGGPLGQAFDTIADSVVNRITKIIGDGFDRLIDLGSKFVINGLGTLGGLLGKGLSALGSTLLGGLGAVLGPAAAAIGGFFAADALLSFIGGGQGTAPQTPVVDAYGNIITNPNDPNNPYANQPGYDPGNPWGPNGEWLGGGGDNGVNMRNTLADVMDVPQPLDLGQMAGETMTPENQMMTVVLETDGRQTARAIFPYLSGESTRLGLTRT